MGPPNVSRETPPKEVLEAILGISGVSRETVAQFGVYVAALRKWQKTINLVSNRSLDNVWSRHVLDSAQLMNFIASPSIHLLDIGSGAGLPGLVLAIVGVERVTLVESDTRKAEFLRFAARKLEISGRVDVLNRRVESLAGIRPNVITSRAVASVDEILNISVGIRDAKTCLILPKGRDVEQELTEARKRWRFSAESFSSLTATTGVILRLGNISLGPDTRSPSS